MIARAVTRLPVETGVSGWEAISRRDFPVRALDGDVTAEWLVIGAGFAGLSAARRLIERRPGERIVILDAQEVARGSAGRNSGFMIDVPHNLSSGEYSPGDAAVSAREIAQNRFAIAYAAAAAADYGMPRETFDPCGKINAAATRRGLRLNDDFRASLARIGEAHETLDAGAMRALTGMDYYLGGVYTPGAVMIQPADYIRALAKGVAATARLFENSPVTALRREGEGWAATTPRGTARARKVILAVNGHLQSFGFAAGRLMHVFTYASMTAAFPASEATGQATWNLLPADPMGATLRKITQGDRSRIVVRTRFTYDPSLTVSERRVARIAREQRASLDARFANLADAPFEFSWAGALCLSRNHVPVFGEIEEGLYSACCENGLGTVKSTLAGVLAVDLATGASNPHLADFLNTPAPRRLPPEPIAWLGVNSVIRFQELRAGREQ